MKFLKTKFLLLGTFLVVILGGLIYISLPKYSPPNSCRGCNVVILDLDILRADALPCYGYFRNTAPNICNFAKKSILFEKNIAPSFWTGPSGLSTLTSLYPFSSGYFFTNDRLSPSVKTMGTVFRQNGYFAQIVDDHADIKTMWTDGLRDFNVKENISIDDWKKEVENLSKSNKPFMAYFYTSYLHSPHLLPEDTAPIDRIDESDFYLKAMHDMTYILSDYLVQEYKNVFVDEVINNYPNLFGSAELRQKNKWKILELFNSFPPQTRFKFVKASAIENTAFGYYYSKLDNNEKEKFVHSMRLVYDTQILSLDKKLGELLQYLSSSSLSQNTIVVIYSDHGEEFFDHGSFFHGGTLYNEILHTPLIVYVPKYKARRISQLSRNIDIFPTLMELLGKRMNWPIDGTSLYELLRNGKDNIKRYAIGLVYDVVYSIQDEKWKLIVCKDLAFCKNNIELYDLKSDPRETKNLAEKYKTKALELRTKMDEIIKKSGKPQPGPFPAFMDEETRKNLIKNGYF